MPHDADPVVQQFEQWLSGRRFAVASAPASTADELASNVERVAVSLVPLPPAATPDGEAPLLRSEVLALLEAQRLLLLEQVTRLLRERGVL